MFFRYFALFPYRDFTFGDFEEFQSQPLFIGILSDLSKFTKKVEKTCFFTNFGQFGKFRRNSSISNLAQKHKIRLDRIPSACYKQVRLLVSLNSGRLIQVETIVKNTLDNHTHFVCVAQQ